jgi:hypothetical protein
VLCSVFILGWRVCGWCGRGAAVASPSHARYCRCGCRCCFSPCICRCCVQWQTGRRNRQGGLLATAPAAEPQPKLPPLLPVPLPACPAAVSRRRQLRRRASGQMSSFSSTSLTPCSSTAWSGAAATQVRGHAGRPVHVWLPALAWPACCLAACLPLLPGVRPFCPSLVPPPAFWRTQPVNYV